MEKKTNYVAPVFPEAIGDFPTKRLLFDSVYDKKVEAKVSGRTHISYTLGIVNLTEISFGTQQYNLYVKDAANILIPYGEYRRNEDGSVVFPKVEIEYKVNLAGMISYLVYEKDKCGNYAHVLIEEIVEPNGSHMINVVYGKISASLVPTQYAIAIKRGRDLPSKRELAAFEIMLRDTVNRYTVYEKVSP
jgi:hypothetical protein